MIWLEEFAPGQRYVSPRRRVDAAAIKAFAAEFDPQPFHLDEDSARGSFFGGLAASGWHTAAFTMRPGRAEKKVLRGALRRDREGKARPRQPRG